jgi:NADPH:quinone reductase-like Zn-dependent oxidoreductase
MNAVFRTRYGGPEVLELKELPKPEPRAGEVVVRVHATTVSRTDCGALWGAPFVYRFVVGFPAPRLPSTGCDFAGEVAAVGAGVTAFQAGDRVMGFDDDCAGTHAEYVSFRADAGIALIPPAIDYGEAAASVEGFHYAVNCLRKLPLDAGRHVLVNGATGAIGSAAVQLFKHEGLEVTAVCAGPNLELVRSLGADHVIDYLEQDFTEDNATYDFVVDTVGKSRFEACKRILKDDGIYISAELGPGGENLYLPLLTSLVGKKKVRFPFPLDIRGSIARAGKLLEQGKFRPLIDRTYRLEQIRDAFTYVASGQKIGNVLLKLV